MKKLEKSKLKPLPPKRAVPEDISFFSLKGYIIAVTIALILALVPPLMFDFNYSTLFTKYGVWYFAYYIIMAAVAYRCILLFVKMNYIN